jgi:hypothetical protein
MVTLEGSVEFMRDVKAGRLAPIPSKNRQAKVAKKSKNGYDDRPSESIRTVSGGLPVLGKRQYSVKEAQGSDFHRPALCSNEVRSSVRTCSQK